MVYIFLPVHNRKSVTEVFIKSLFNQRNKEFKLVLIDDGCVDGTTEMVLDYLPDTIVLKGDGKLWWGGALQLAYDWACENLTEETCLIINDDTVIDENFVNKGACLIESNPNSLILAQTFSLNSNKLLDKGVHFDYKTLSFKQANSCLDINCLSTRGLFLSADVFIKIGGFYPRLLPHYLSDYEFTIRAGRKGFNLLTKNELKLQVNQGTTGYHKIEYRGIKSYYLEFFSNKNASNPRHLFCFVLLTCPFPYNVINAARVSMMGIKGLFYPLKLTLKI